MEFKFRAIDGQSPPYNPPSSSMSYFTGQAIREGAREREDQGRDHCGGDRAKAYAGGGSEERDDVRERNGVAQSRRALAFRGVVVPDSRFSRLNQSEGRSLEERLALSLEQKLGYQGRPMMEGFQTMPFQRSSEPKITEIKSPSELGLCLDVLAVVSLDRLRLSACSDMPTVVSVSGRLYQPCS
ncbi:hypothetical protein Acr_00g0017250 [Actinidia rufa]|uniref:Uncharacterized protein n=1 Tax=Actinidia rufa TaxID=165716 RepID=A0A7J0DCW5_9ERIC|nr:hypothetical protein Acr_00g0017250 [Actinidia rufa]